MGAWELGFLALSTTRPSRLQSQEEALTPVKHAPSFSRPTALSGLGVGGASQGGTLVLSLMLTMILAL